MLFEHSIHKFNRNSAFSVQNYSSKVFFYPFPRNDRLAIPIKKKLREAKGYLLEGSVVESIVSFKKVLSVT